MLVLRGIASVMTGRAVTLGELLLCLKAPGRERLLHSPMLEASFGGGKAKVAFDLCHLGPRGHVRHRAFARCDRGGCPPCTTGSGRRRLPHRTQAGTQGHLLYRSRRRPVPAGPEPRSTGTDPAKGRVGVKAFVRLARAGVGDVPRPNRVAITARESRSADHNLLGREGFRANGSTGTSSIGSRAAMRLRRAWFRVGGARRGRGGRLRRQAHGVRLLQSSQRAEIERLAGEETSGRDSR